MTQADLASRIGVTQSDLSRMENGEYKVGLDTLFKILQVFELSMSRFFEEPSPAAEPASGLSEREQLLVDFEELPESSRREVREFVAFKKMQAETRRPQWKPDDELAESTSGGKIEPGPASRPENGDDTP